MFENKAYPVILVNLETGEVINAVVKAVDPHEAREFVKKDLTNAKNMIGLVHEATA